MDTIPHHPRYRAGRGTDRTMRTFLDVDGLSNVGAERLRPYAQSDYPEAVPIPNRMALLAALREGAGVRVITGPSGASYWSLVSKEVQVRVWPDDYEYQERVETPREWGYRAVGASPAEARELLKRTKAPTVAHRLYRYWDDSERLLGVLADYQVEPLVEEEVPFELVTLEAFEARLDKAQREGEFLALDGEWDPETGRIVGLAASSGDSNYYVCLWASDVEYRPAYEQRVRAAFGNFVRLGGQGVLHNGRSDLAALLSFDPVDCGSLYAIHDTIILAYLLGEDELGLKPLTRKFLGRDPQSYPGDLTKMPARMQARYAAAGDTRNMYDLFTVLLPLVYATGQMPVYLDIERPLVPIVASMEKYGIPVDMVAVKRMYREHVTVEEALRRAVMENYGYDIKTDTGTLEFLWAQGLPHIQSVDQRIISQSKHWSVDLVLEYRHLRTRRRNFLGKALKYDHCRNHPAAIRRLFKERQAYKKDGKLTALGRFLLWRNRIGDQPFRYFPRFNQAGSVDEAAVRAPRSGRFSSSDPNLQQQPETIRYVYVPPEGCLLWAYDWKNMEMYIAAGVSRDPVMVEALMAGADLHKLLQDRVHQMSGLNIEKVVAKRWNFGKLYGAYITKLIDILAQARVFLDRETADILDKAHSSLYTVYPVWAKEMVQLSHVRGYAETVFGRRRQLVEYQSNDAEVIGTGERAGVNHIIQGTGADVCKMSMNGLVRVMEQFGGHIALQVHDELVGWVPEDVDVDAFNTAMKEVMEVEVAGMRLKVSGGVGHTWADVH